MSDKQPYLSLVLTGRNDNYGGDFRNRLQRCVSNAFDQLTTFGIRSEIIFVNYNPVADNTPIKKFIDWPRPTEKVNVRVITVPDSIHQQYVDPLVRNTVPVFEFIAKNAGIRRAKGSFILCINADVLIHPKIFKFISEGKLNEKFYYRANRIDFRKADTTDPNRFFENAFAVSLKGFMYFFADGINRKLQYRLLKVFNKLRIRWELFKFRHSGLANFLRLNVVYNNGAYLAHCLNSGDFMLMAANSWNSLRGYPEYTFVSTHTDAILSVMAHNSLKEKIFSDPIFHQEHKRRYTWDSIVNDGKFEKTYALFEQVATAVKRNESVKPYLNNNDWGLNGHDLKEKMISCTE